MRQIVYHSVASDDLDEGEIFRIISQASANNSRSDLTGFLIFSGGRFLQLLEGEERELLRVFDKIKQDDRHTDVSTAYEVDISQRSFPDWRMKRFSASDSAEALDALGKRQGGLLAPRVVDAVTTFFDLSS